MKMVPFYLISISIKLYLMYIHEIFTINYKILSNNEYSKNELIFMIFCTIRLIELWLVVVYIFLKFIG